MNIGVTSEASKTGGHLIKLYSNVQALARAIIRDPHLFEVFFNSRHPAVPVPFARVDLDSFQSVSRCDEAF